MSAESNANEPVSTLSVLSTDLLFVTLGLWISRAVLLVLKHREHVSGRAARAGPG